MLRVSPPFRILVIGDSLSLHRSRDGQTLDETWPWQVKSAVPGAEVWVRSQPASLVQAAVAEIRLFESSLHLFDLVIVQAGITDSCPRPLAHWSHRLLGHVANGALQRLINRHYALLLRLRRKSWTSPADFRAALTDIAARVTPRTRLMFVPIVPPCKKLSAKVPGVGEAVDRYNAIIREVQATHACGRVTCLTDFGTSCSAECVLDDGHHLNARGHELLAELIARAIATRAPMARAA
ncbi:MAG: hypothetical protein NVSMB2_01940 [Chloroflexota bacterium]